LESKLADRNVTMLPLNEAAALLRLPSSAVEALVSGGYLPRAQGPDGLTFPLSDLKAFVARNDDNGAGNLWNAPSLPAQLDEVDPRDLIDGLDGRSEELAGRLFDVYATVFPEAATWNDKTRDRFVAQARSRFEAILAVTGQGSEVDEALAGDLLQVGASAAAAGSPLPQLLVILRISRDLIVETGVELAAQRSRQGAVALIMLLSRVLPAIDRLTDALAQGYWTAMNNRQDDSRSRLENVVEHASLGVYEVDLDGCIRYANRSLASILGYPWERLEGAPLADVIRPRDHRASIEPLMLDRTDAGHRVTMDVVRPDGATRVLEVEAMPRHDEGVLVGFQGIVRDQGPIEEVAPDTAQ
jgi:PAS domain S-box-containing protein